MVIGYVIWLYYDMKWYDMIWFWNKPSISSQYHCEYQIISNQNTGPYLISNQWNYHQCNQRLNISRSRKLPNIDFDLLIECEYNIKPNIKSWFFWISEQHALTTFNWRPRNFNMTHTHTLEELSTESFDHLLQGSTEYTLLFTRETKAPLIARRKEYCSYKWPSLTSVDQ